MEQAKTKGIENNLRISPEDITVEFLGRTGVFCFGSNEAGLHGAGAAKFAFEKMGARLNQGFGFMGQCFGIPTKDWDIGQLDIKCIQFYVERFIEFTKIKYSRNWDFFVTQIGCGLAGFTPPEIAPSFKPCLDIKNVWLPQTFHDVLNGTYVAPPEPVYGPFNPLIHPLGPKNNPNDRRIFNA